MTAKIDILNFAREELAEDLLTNLGVEKYRASQLMQWLYRARATDFGVMTNISRPVKEKLTERYRIYRPAVHTVQLSNDGTRKFLFELDDGSKVETVLIRQPKRYTLCVSSQVGCAIGCKFCRTGTMGLKRHLQTHEILGQFLAVQDKIEELKRDLSPAEHPPEAIPQQFENIVFMGMGEPLHNYENVVRAVRLLNDELGFNFSKRKITVSTSGLVPALEKFGETKVPANLAISLNATTNEVRDRLIPINKKWPLEKLLETLRNFPLGGRQRITIEYVMLRDVNDTEADMKRLPKLLQGIPSKVNLIPYNDNTGLGFFGPHRENLDRWQSYLLSQNMTSTIRWSKGQDISAACGQLATAS
jgi:23S rRNA (adenine2503-C2)-methyltransferase